MFRFFQRKSSCQVAKDRLKILLISDRVNCSPEVMDLIKTDIAKVISKYMKIDTENMDNYYVRGVSPYISQVFKENGNGRASKTPVLYANIPILDLHK